MKSYGSYAVLVFAFALMGTYLASFAQPGGISHTNGFVAPIMGPWSRVLSPNAQLIQHVASDHYAFTFATTLVVIGLVVVSPLPKHRGVRIPVKVLAHLAVVYWCLCGLVKVVVELA